MQKSTSKINESANQLRANYRNGSQTIIKNATAKRKRNNSII